MPVSTAYKVGAIIFGFIGGVIGGIVPAVFIVLIFAIFGMVSDTTVIISYLIGVIIVAGAVYGKEKDKQDLLDAINSKT